METALFCWALAFCPATAQQELGDKEAWLSMKGLQQRLEDKLDVKEHRGGRALLCGQGMATRGQSFNQLVLSSHLYLEAFSRRESVGWLQFEQELGLGPAVASPFFSSSYEERIFSVLSSLMRKERLSLRNLLRDIEHKEVEQILELYCEVGG